jgi:undecaprenyl diphosphate synthase
MQSKPADESARSDPSNLHVAIIMDGNRRWAERRGLPPVEGHRAGAEAVRRVVRAALDESILILTLFAFSAHNWGRSRTEVTHLLSLLERHLLAMCDECVTHDVRVRALGRRDRLPSSMVRAIERLESTTASCTRLTLRLAIDYSARETIVSAARRFNLHAAAGGAMDGFSRLLARGEDPPPPDVDLLIRTGGDHRLSDFLLWECAQAELLFLPMFWPEFDAAALAAALATHRAHERRLDRGRYLGGLEAG